MKTIMSVIVSLAITLEFTQAQSPNLLPGDATIVAAAGDQTAPAIAQGGNLLLAVWTDNRPNPYPSGFYAWSEYETSRDIYGVRLDTAGNVLDAIPLAIVAHRSNQNYPKVSWNGTNWLVVYQSVDVGGTGYYAQDSIEAVRVAPSGQVLDAKPIKLYGLTPSNSSYWTLASDGNNWVVVSQGNSTSSDIVAVRISAAGVVLDPPTRGLVPATYYGRFNFKLAYASGVFALTYSDEFINGNNNTKLVRFDSNLTKLNAAPLTLLDVSLSDLAGNGTSFYIVWNRQELDGLVHVVGSRVSTAGVKLDGTGVNISGTKEPGYGTVTAVVWDGVNWRLTWSDITTFWIARVNAGGVVLDPGSVAVAGVQTGPTTGNGAGVLQVIWTEFTNINHDVFTASISPGNVAGPSRVLSVGAPQQTQPDIATSGNGYMMVYRSAASTQGRVLAQPLDAAGNPLTAEPVQLDSGLNINGPGNPNVAWNGSLYLVSWGTPNGIVAQRLSATGVTLDAPPFMVMSGCFGSADVAALGSDFLVTGLKTSGSIQYIGPVAARVSGAGAVLDASPLFLGISYVGRAPVVVALGGRWLAAWHRNATHDNSSCFSMGAFIAAGGTVTPEFQIHGPFSTAGGNGIFEVGLASSGNKALFVQSQELTSGVENDLLCRVIDATGSVGPQVNLTPWSGNQYRPRVAWDGANFIVTYQDQKNSLAEQGLEQLDARSDLFAMRVTPTGAIVDPQGFLFSALPTGETDPTVVSLNGVTILAGSAVLNDATFANYRIVYERRDATLNKWPVAVATAAPTGGDVPLPVSFSSAGSGDLDGTITGYFWDFGDGTTSTAANPSHTYTLTGPFVATLTVTDNGGATATQTILVKAVAPNQLPVAVASAVPVSGPPPLNVIFYADGSYDPDGFLGNLQWTFSDGGSYWGSPAYYTFSSAGTYTATLTVYDSLGATGTASLTIYVGTTLPPSPTPTPTATATPIATPAPTPTPTPPPMISTSGNVSYCSSPTANPVAGATMTLTGTMSGSTLSDGSGNYTFTSLPSGGNYTVTPTKPARLPGSAGINTLDVVAVQRHALGILPLLTGCKLAAANANPAPGVTTLDVIAVQRFVIGLSTGIANTGKYQFTPASRSYSPLVLNQTGQNYDALVYGDVATGFVHRPDGGPSQDAAGDSAGEVPATVAAIALPEVAVDQSRSNFIAAVTTSAIEEKSKLVGFQGDFTFDERAVTFQSEPVRKAGITGGNWNVSGNVLAGAGPIRTLRISAYSNDFTPLSGSGTLFELRMTRVSKAAQGTPLLWAAPPDQFIFIDADLNTQKPSNAAPGNVTPSSGKRK